jgi:hypothetical protein
MEPDVSLPLNVFLSVHHSISVWWNQRDALFIQSYWELRASTCFEHYLLILRRRYNETASWHSQLKSYARNKSSGVCVAPSEDEQVMLETCRGLWFSIKLNEKCITLVSLNWFITAITSAQASQKMVVIIRKWSNGNSRPRNPQVSPAHQGGFFFKMVFIISMPHYMVILHALHLN